ncbi:MAG: hypothetical protein JW700_00570 [Candidatus Aenigmarchaeota archaeon]|nr:hypothetical protein [Candidatus Aenigmarchaeota archaeon]
MAFNDKTNFKKILTQVQHNMIHRSSREPIGYADLVEKHYLSEKYDKLIAAAEKKRREHPEKYEPINWANYEKKN